MAVTGIGKSGHVARKVAATLGVDRASRPSFLHPAEASHGDLGMVADGDVGSRPVVVRARRRSCATWIKHCQAFPGLPLIAITADAGKRAGPGPPTWPWCCPRRRRRAPIGSRRPPRRPCRWPSATPSPSRFSRVAGVLGQAISEPSTRAADSAPQLMTVRRPDAGAASSCLRVTLGCHAWPRRSSRSLARAAEASASSTKDGRSRRRLYRWGPAPRARPEAASAGSTVADHMSAQRRS